MFDELTKRKLVSLVKKYDTDIGIICKCMLYWSRLRCKYLNKSEDEVYIDYLKFWKKKIASLGLDETVLLINGKPTTIADECKPNEILPFTKSEIDWLITSKILEYSEKAVNKYIFTNEFTEDLLFSGRVIFTEFKEVYPLLVKDLNGVDAHLIPAPMSYAEIYNDAVGHSISRHNEIIENVLWMKNNYDKIISQGVKYWWTKQEKFIDALDDNIRIILALKNKYSMVSPVKKNHVADDELTE